MLKIISLMILLGVVSLIFPRRVKQKFVADYRKGRQVAPKKEGTDAEVPNISVKLQEEPKKTTPFLNSDIFTVAEEVYYGVLYFANETYFSSENSARTPSASIIKVFIMEYIFEGVAEGLISQEDLIKGQTVHALVRDMIQKSDNNATNMLIDYFGMESINQWLETSEYADTVLARRMLDFEVRNRGVDNYTSLNDTMAFLQKLYRRRNTFPYNEMLEILKGQTVRTKISSLLPVGTVVANKTGELEDVENDMGIVFSDQSDFAIVVLATGVYQWEQAREEIASLALAALEYLR